ncbi:MAG: alkaline phosphatase [Clostridia bacterium]|nr:alkaline phosphatase [Clostridia bacterium]
MSKKIYRATSFIICLCILFTMGLGANAETSNSKSSPQIKNVIFLIGDGMSIPSTTLARWYNGGEPLAMDEIATGLVRTYWAAGPITDSAPAASAMATGYKTSDKFISILPEKVTMPGVPPLNTGDSLRPAATVLEGAKLQGKAVGLVATSNIQNATPAAFSSHARSRSEYDSIAEQQVFNNLDVVLSAGTYFLSPETRKDKEDLIRILKNTGYDFITTPAQMAKTKSDKVWGAFDPESLAYDMDRDPSKQPSLSEMTEKAISVLSRDEDGFFLMVEGSKIDWAAHANDPIGVISDVLAFDKAIKAAVDFAKKDGNTVVIACADHGTGGISIGSPAIETTYSGTPLSTFTDPLKKAKLTGEGLEKKFNADRSNIKEVMAEYYGITDLTDDEIKQIKDAKFPGLNWTVGKMISKRANISWVSTGHVGDEVALYCYSPDSNDKLSGVIQNTDIPKYIAKLFNMNLDEISKKLFVPAVAAFEAKGAKVEVDNTNPANPVVVVTKGTTTLKLPVNKNVAYLNRALVRFNGLTVLTDKVYVPQQVIDMIR